MLVKMLEFGVFELRNPKHAFWVDCEVSPDGVSVNCTLGIVSDTGIDFHDLYLERDLLTTTFSRKAGISTKYLGFLDAVTPPDDLGGIAVYPMKAVDFLSRTALLVLVESRTKIHVRFVVFKRPRGQNCPKAANHIESAASSYITASTNEAPIVSIIDMAKVVLVFGTYLWCTQLRFGPLPNFEFSICPVIYRVFWQCYTKMAG
jgi:hypothetical protein